VETVAEVAKTFGDFQGQAETLMGFDTRKLSSLHYKSPLSLLDKFT